MKKTVKILILSCLIISCATNKIKGFKNVTYTSKFQTSSLDNPFEKRNNKMSIPKGFLVDKEDLNPEYKEVVYKYDNSIKIYITDNVLGGSTLNGDNKLNEGITSINRKSLKDSVYMYGVQKDDKYWKENIFKRYCCRLS